MSLGAGCTRTWPPSPSTATRSSGRTQPNSPETSLTVAGAKLPEAVRSALRGDGLEAHSDVPDLRPFYWSHRVLAVPLRAGSGTRLKILEAAAAGIPVVSTTLGAEGLPLVDGRHLRIADSPQAFADAIAETLADPDAAAARARAAREVVSRDFDWPAIMVRNLAAVRELVDELSPDERVAPGPRDGVVPPVAVVIAAFAGEGRALRRTLESLERAGLPPGAERIAATGLERSGGSPPIVTVPENGSQPNRARPTSS